MARRRCFLAVNLDDATRQKVAALQRTLAIGTESVKWVEPRNLHITILFLGEVDDRDSFLQHKLMTKIAKTHDPFTLRFEGLGAFPTPRRPKVLWTGLAEGEKELKGLHADLEEAFSESHTYRKEDRAYAPHLTLGRITTDTDSEKLAEAIPQHTTWTAGPVAIEEVLLFTSELRRDGPEYTIFARAPLGRD
jgi:RNA 2',3'-cyclic 3'-phosphodiesterase